MNIIDNYYKLGKIDFRNELIKRLNKVKRHQFIRGGQDIEMFDVDEVYEIIDRVYDGIAEDDGRVD